VGGEVQLGPLGTAATNRPIVPAPGDYDNGEIGGMNGRENRSTRRKPAPVPLCQPQTHHAAWTRTRAAAVGSQRLIAWATARPATTRNYKKCSSIADLHTLQFTVTHTLRFSVFTSRILATDSKTVFITLKVFSSQADFEISTEPAAVSTQSSSTVISGYSLSCYSAGLGSSLYSLGSAPRENTVS
jgi:hypothetical protein